MAGTRSRSTASIAIGPMFRHPVLVARGVCAFHANQLSFDGLDLAAAYGNYRGCHDGL